MGASVTLPLPTSLTKQTPIPGEFPNAINSLPRGQPWFIRTAVTVDSAAWDKARPIVWDTEADMWGLWSSPVENSGLHLMKACSEQVAEESSFLCYSSLHLRWWEVLDSVFLGQNYWSEVALRFLTLLGLDYQALRLCFKLERAPCQRWDFCQYVPRCSTEGSDSRTLLLEASEVPTRHVSSRAGKMHPGTMTGSHNFQDPNHCQDQWAWETELSFWRAWTRDYKLLEDHFSKEKSAHSNTYSGGVCRKGKQFSPSIMPEKWCKLIPHLDIH